MPAEDTAENPVAELAPEQDLGTGPVATETIDGKQVRKHDFRSPATLSKGDLRSLRLHHEEFIRALAARLSLYLRADVDLQISKLQTVTYRSFVESLPYVSDLTLFKIAPLQGICILDIAPRLGLAIVDRLMGGPGQAAEEERDMSEIEHALLDQAVEVTLSEWRQHWPALRNQQPQILGHEQHGRFLQTAPPRAVMLVLAMEARFVDCVEQVQMVFPYDELEPMVRELRSELNVSTAPKTNRDALRSQWKPQLENIPVKIQANFPGVNVTARDLTRMTVGQVLELQADSPEQIRIHIANKPKYVGQLGAQGDHRAIRLTQPFDC